ncbi:hypothetical protein B296_00027844 [Ensete ventricosum]|uniref:Uncharacterized protein n=1 Tax=Ensete ventricosum TaxID=4639 RepID=A0A427A4S6_ENSVE|nr:hypothetical protein B296_00027844 [Ensete ventricosum]
MLMSGSTSSTSIASGVHGASIGTSNNSMPWHFSSPSPSFYSATSHPTVTLDLTAPSSTPQLRFPSNFSSISGHSSGVSFSTTESSTLPIPWSNIYPNYGVQPYTKSSTASLFLGRQPQDTFNLSYLPKTSSSAPSLPSQRSLTDMIAGAITSHPSFQSALTAAVTSYIGGARGAQAGKEILSPKISHNIPRPLPPHHGWRTNLTAGIRLLLLPPRSLHRRPPLGPHRRRDLRALASDHRSHLRRRRHPSHPHPPRCRPGRGDPHLPLFPRGTYRTGRHGQVQGAAYPDLAGLGAATRRRRSASGAHPLASGHPRGARQRGEGVRQVEHDLPAVGEGKGRFALMSASVSHWSRTIMWIPEPERGRSRKQVLTWSIGRAQCLMRKASFNIRTGAGCFRMLRWFVSLSLWSNRLSCNLVHEGTEEESQVREGTEESHMLNPCILPELVKRSDERECDEPGFMAIGDVVEIALEDQMCKTRTEPEKMGLEDAVTESVASEFLSMLGIEDSLFSPRVQLREQFEKESVASGDDLFGLESLDNRMETLSCWDDWFGLS